MAQTSSLSAVSGLALVMAAAAMWATVGVAAELVPNAARLPDEIFGLARTALAAPLVLAVATCWPPGSRKTAGLPRLSTLLEFAAAGAIFQVCLFKCFSMLGVTVTVFLTVCLPPLITLIGSLLRGRSQISGTTIVALAVAIFGLYCFAANGLGTAYDLAGLALAVAASIAFVIMSCAARSMSQCGSPVMVSGLGLAATALLLLPTLLFIAPGDWQPAQETLSDVHVLVLLAYLGAGPTALAYVCYCSGMARCRSAVAGLVASMIEPGLAAILAAVLLGELMSTLQIVGSLLLTAAMTILWWAEYVQARATGSAAKLTESLLAASMGGRDS